MKQFLLQLVKAIKKYEKSTLVVLVATFLSLITAISGAFKLLSETPLSIILIGLYIFIVIGCIISLRAAKKPSANKNASGSKARDKRIAIFVLSVSTLFMIGYYGYPKIFPPPFEEKICLITANFRTDSLNDDFSRRLNSELYEAVRNDREIIVKKVDRYYQNQSGVENDIKNYFAKSKILHGLFCYGDYAPSKNSLMCFAYPYNLSTSYEINDPAKPGDKFTLRIPQQYQFEFDTTIGTTRDFILGLLWQRLGRIDASKEVIKKYVTDPSIAGNIKSNILNLYADNLMMKGNSSEAIAYYEEAKLLNPDNAELTFNLGAAYALRGNYETSALVFNQVRDKYSEAKDYSVKYGALSQLANIKPTTPINDPFDTSFTLVAGSGKILIPKSDSIGLFFLKKQSYYIAKVGDNYTFYDEKGKPVNQEVILRSAPKNSRVVSAIH